MKNEYKVTKETVVSEAKGYHFRSISRVIFCVCWCIAGLYFGAMSVLFFAAGNWLYGAFGFLIVLFCAYKLFVFPVRYFSNKYKLLAAQYRTPEWTRTVEFSDEEIVYTDHKTSLKIKYTDIEKVKEKGNTVLLILGGHMLMRIYKDAFVEGSWEECKEKLASSVK